MTTYWITAVRHGKCVVLHRECVVSAARAVSRLRELGWKVEVLR
jgi:hypothetical protein